MFRSFRALHCFYGNGNGNIEKDNWWLPTFFLVTALGDPLKDPLRSPERDNWQPGAGDPPATDGGPPEDSLHRDTSHIFRKPSTYSGNRKHISETVKIFRKPEIDFRNPEYCGNR
jgi:hypothetical protein